MLSLLQQRAVRYLSDRYRLATYTGDPGKAIVVAGHLGFQRKTFDSLVRRNLAERLPTRGNDKPGYKFIPYDQRGDDMQTQTDQQIDQQTREQVNRVFRVQLGGVLVNQADGPNESSIEFWNIDGRIVLVQKFPGNGWQYYLPGGEPIVENIGKRIANYLRRHG